MANWNCKKISTQILEHDPEPALASLFVSIASPQEGHGYSYLKPAVSLHKSVYSIPLRNKKVY